MQTSAYKAIHIDKNMTDKTLEHQMERTSEYIGVQTPKVPGKAEETEQHANDKQKKAPAVPSVSFGQLYSYAEGKDKVIMAIGVIFAIINGITLPMLGVLLKSATNGLIPYDQHAINKAAIQYLILSLVLLVSGYAYYVCFKYTAEKQIKKIRVECFRRILFQEIAWLISDTNNNNVEEEYKWQYLASIYAKNTDIKNRASQELQILKARNKLSNEKVSEIKNKAQRWINTNWN